MTHRTPVDPAAAAQALRALAGRAPDPPLPSAAPPAAIRPPAEESAASPPLDLRRARRMGDIFEGLMRVQQAAAEAVAESVFDGIPPPDDPIEAELWQALVALNRALLSHPIAVRAACDALRAEGRQYAETAEGAALRRRLQAAPTLARAEVIWRSATMGAFEGEPDVETALPSAWLDVFTRVAGWQHLERLLGRLAGGAS